MFTEFHTKATALDENFLKGLIAMYTDKPISIFVEEDLDETEYLLRSPSNRKMLEESLKSKEGYEFSIEEFNKLKRDFQKGKKIDFSRAKKVKLPK